MPSGWFEDRRREDGCESALDTGLPALGDYDGVLGPDWEYRTFRLSDPMSTLPRAFMKAGVTTT